MHFSISAATLKDLLTEPIGGKKKIYTDWNYWRKKILFNYCIIIDVFKFISLSLDHQLLLLIACVTKINF